MSVEFIAQSTLLYFLSDSFEPKQNIDKKMIVVDKVFDVQRRSSVIDRRQFEKLERFYADIFDNRASACVDVWIAVGVSFECLSTMMRSASVYSVAFDMVSFLLSCLLHFLDWFYLACSAIIWPHQLQTQDLLAEVSPFVSYCSGENLLFECHERYWFNLGYVVP